MRKRRSVGSDVLAEEEGIGPEELGREGGGEDELGSDSGGQSGDIQGLSGLADADSESVEELAEEGQAFEADVVSGVEGAPDADVAEVHVHEPRADKGPPRSLLPQ